jgi:DNA-binding LacI/PurR family transcriptional regulator
MTTPRRTPPRQADVARAAGVSQSAVSRVISGEADSARIPLETRRRILDAIKELGYVPNAAARNLRNKRNRLLGVHTFEPVFPHARDDFYFDFLLGIEEQAEKIGYDLVLFTSTGSGDGRRRVYRDGTNRLNLADGAILLGVSTDRAELARLRDDGYPFIHIGRREIPDGEIPCIIPDYRSAADALVQRLAGLGHRRLAYLREPLDIEPYVDRRAGYAEAIRRLNLVDESRGFAGEPGLAEGWLDQIAAGGETAIVAESERLADTARRGLAARGVHVPRDVSIAVLEGPSGGREWGGEPSGVRWEGLQIPRKTIGALAVDRLVAMLDDPGEHTGSVLVPCQLVGGDTVGDVRSHL